MYKAKHLYDTWKQGGPEGALYSASSSGWMESANFISWFKKMFLKQVEYLLKDGPVVLFVDGHHSHITLELINLAREYKVHLMCLPPNLTHILQPLDISVFHPLKQAYFKILKEYKLETLAENVTKAVFPSLLRKLWEVSFKPNHLTSGFKTTGLHPLNRQAITDSQLQTGIPYRKVQGAKATSPPHTQPASASSVILRGKCKKCDAELTPMRAHITLHFTRILQKKHCKKMPQRKRRVQLTCYGEALTSDEIVARLERQAAAKQNPSHGDTVITSNNDENGDDDEYSSHDEGILQCIKAILTYNIALYILVYRVWIGT